MRMSNSVMVAAIIVALPCIAGVQPPPTSKADAVNRATASYRGIEVPAAKTGTGPHDFYSLFARLPIVTETIYGIGIATNNKVSQDDAQVVAEGLGTLK